MSIDGYNRALDDDMNENERAFREATLERMCERIDF